MKSLEEILGEYLPKLRARTIEIMAADADKLVGNKEAVAEMARLREQLKKGGALDSYAHDFSKLEELAKADKPADLMEKAKLGVTILTHAEYIMYPSDFNGSVEEAGQLGLLQKFLVDFYSDTNPLDELMEELQNAINGSETGVQVTYAYMDDAEGMSFWFECPKDSVSEGQIKGVLSKMQESGFDILGAKFYVYSMDRNRN